MSPALSAAVVVLGLGFVLLVVAAASGTTEVKRWLLIKIPAPVAQWRKPLGIIGGALLAVGVVLVVLGSRPPEKDPPPDRFADCASHLKRTGTTNGIDDDTEPTRSGVFKVAPRPVDLVATSTGVFVAHRDGRITKISRAETASEVEPLPGSKQLPGRPTDAVAIAYGLESIWIVKRDKEGSNQGLLAKISRMDGALQGTPLPVAKPDDVAVGGGVVWVIAGTNLLKINPENLRGRPKTEEIGGDPHGLWVAPPCVYVAITEPDGFVAFNIDNGKRIGTYEVGGAREVAGGAGALWLTSRKEHPPAILRVDPDHPKQKAKEIHLPRDVPPADDALAVSRRAVWTAGGADTVFHVDLPGQKPRRLPVPGQPWAVAASDDGELIWVAQRKGDMVTRIMVR